MLTFGGGLVTKEFTRSGSLVPLSSIRDRFPKK
jgi:hypothetical protein